MVVSLFDAAPVELAAIGNSSKDENPNASIAGTELTGRYSGADGHPSSRMTDLIVRETPLAKRSANDANEIFG